VSAKAKTEKLTDNLSNRIASVWRLYPCRGGYVHSACKRSRLNITLSISVQ